MGTRKSIVPRSAVTSYKDRSSMANSKHLARLQQGVASWNQFRIENPKFQPDLSRAELGHFELRGINLDGANLMGSYFARGNLERASLRGAHLIGADFSGANLREIDLREANLSVAHLMGADLREARLDRANLNRADLNRADLSEATLTHAHAIGVAFSGANLMGTDLSDTCASEANFIGANLVGANLTQANLNGTYCSGANLSGANLTRTNLGGANLIGANLSALTILDTNLSDVTCTGACIDGWCVRSPISLSGVTCDYIYQRSYYDRGTLQYRDRLPHDTGRHLAPGELASFIGQAIETVDLSFDRGIEWEAFFRAFNVLQNQMRAELDGAEIAIQAMEKKLDGTFAIRIEVPPETDGAMVQNQFQALYDRALPAIVERPLNPTTLVDDRRASANHFLDFTQFFSSNSGFKPAHDLQDAPRTQPYKPPVPSTLPLHSKGRHKGSTVSRSRISQNPDTTERDRLLQILDRVYPANIPAHYRAEMEVAVGRINQDPLLKAKVTASLYSGGIASVRSQCDSPYISLLLAAYEGWQVDLSNDIAG